MPPISFLALILATLLIFPVVLCDHPAFGPQDEDAYTVGHHGAYPEQHFESSTLVGPRLLRRTWDASCSETDDRILVAPHGLWATQPGPMILDGEGHMMWHAQWPKPAYGLAVQKYKGKDYLTFWTGVDNVKGHGSGVYYMLDEHYREFARIDAIGNLTGDLHEFAITSDDTALFTSYVAIEADLTSYNRSSKGWIWENIIQEVDLATNTLLFTWRASDHFDFADCFFPPLFRDTGTSDNPWDWFHINSIEKDRAGNYLISARYSHAVSYISGATGEVLWHLGGRNNSFKDLSGGRATNFAWQHHARWADDGAAITVFDNQAQSNEVLLGPNDRPSRGVKVALDRKAMTARTVVDLIHPLHYVAASQGSMQSLPGGTYMLGYGSMPGFTEFDADGRVLCDALFGSQMAQAGTDHSNTASVENYRTFKHKWVGKPLTEPDVKVRRDALFVSWNGATEVKQWVVEGLVADSANPEGKSHGEWELVGRTLWAGFESNVTAKALTGRTVLRLTALDRSGNSLGAWRVLPGGTGNANVQPIDIATAPTSTARTSSYVVGLCGICIGILLCLLAQRRSALLEHSRRWWSPKGTALFYEKRPRPSHVPLSTEFACHKGALISVTSLSSVGEYHDDEEAARRLLTEDGDGGGGMEGTPPCPRGSRKA